MQRLAKRQLLAFFTLLLILCAILAWIGHLDGTGADLRSILIW